MTNRGVVLLRLLVLLVLTGTAVAAPRTPRRAATRLVAVPVRPHPREMGVQDRDEYVKLLTRYARGRVSADEVRTRVGSRRLADLALRLVDEGVHLARNWRTELKVPTYRGYPRPPVEDAAWLAAYATHFDLDLDRGREYAGIETFVDAAPAGYRRRLETADRLVAGKARRSSVERAFGEAPDPTLDRPAPDPRGLVRRLPTPGTPEFTRLVDDAKRSLETQGYAIIPTSRYISARVGRAEHARMSEFIGSYQGVLQYNAGRRRHVIDPRPHDLAPSRALLRWHHKFAEAIAGGATLNPLDQVYVREDGQGPIIEGWHYDGPPIVLGTDLIADKPRVYPTIRTRIKSRFSNAPVAVRPGTPTVGVAARDTVVLLGMDATLNKRAPGDLRALGKQHGPTAHGTAPGESPRMLVLSGHSVPVKDDFD